MSHHRRKNAESSSGWLWKSILIIVILIFGFVFKMSLDLEPHRQIVERPISEQILD